MHLSMIRPGEAKTLAATFGTNAMAVVRSLQAPTFRVEATVLYGKLKQLIDRTMVEDEESEKAFWGELHSDNGEVWRVKFKGSDEDIVPKYFRKLVRIVGTAVYYRLANPKLECDDISLEPERDYVKAIDELWGCDKGVYKTDLSTILKEIHGEE